MRISLSMAYSKQQAEAIITGAALNLFVHTLKHLIFVDAYSGEYTGWEDEVADNVLPLIGNAALNVKTKKRRLDRQTVVALCQYYWRRTRLPLDIRSVYDNRKYTNIVKRMNSKEFEQWLAERLPIIDQALENLVSQIYEEQHTDLEMSVAYFCALRNL